MSQFPDLYNTILILKDEEELISLSTGVLSELSLTQMRAGTGTGNRTGSANPD